MALSRVTPAGWLEETGPLSHVTPFGWIQESQVGSTGYTLVLDTGSYSTNGADLFGIKSVNLVLGTENFSIDGQDISLLLEGSYRLTLDSGSYNITGIVPNVDISAALGSGVYTTLGRAVSLRSSTEASSTSTKVNTMSVTIRIGL